MSEDTSSEGGLSVRVRYYARFFQFFLLLPLSRAGQRAEKDVMAARFRWVLTALLCA